MNIWFDDGYDYGDENESNNDTSTEIQDEESYNDTISHDDSGNEHEATAEEGNSTFGSNDYDTDNDMYSDDYLKWRYVYIYYTTANVITYSSDLMIDFPGFISSTGGNMGLFLGFSFMGMLFSLYEWMEARLLNHNVGKKTKVGTSNAGFTK